MSLAKSMFLQKLSKSRSKIKIFVNIHDGPLQNQCAHDKNNVCYLFLDDLQANQRMSYPLQIT